MLTFSIFATIFIVAMIEVQLPEVIDDGRLDWALALMNASRAIGADGGDLRLNWGKVREISPGGMAILCCICDSLIEQRNHVKCVFVPKRFKEIPVVRSLTGIRPDSPLPPPGTYDFEDDDTMLRGRCSLDVMMGERFREKFSGAVAEDIAYDCLLILNELMQNTVDHSTAERYFLYAGLWGNELHAGVLDMGVTIPAKMQQRFSCSDDLEYLEFALKPGTTTRRQRTGGVGLSYFFSFLKRNGGKLTVMSREAQVRRYFSTRKSQRDMLKYPLRGTWCFARFPLRAK